MYNSLLERYTLIQENRRLKQELSSNEESLKLSKDLVKALTEQNHALRKRIIAEDFYEIIGAGTKETSQTIKEESNQHNCDGNCKCNNPMLEKEEFVNIIKQIQKGYDRRNKLSDALEEVNEGWFICNIGEEWVNTLITLLCFMMRDITDDDSETIIEWWLYSEEPKVLVVTENGESRNIDVTKPEDLYDYLVSRI